MPPEREFAHIDYEGGTGHRSKEVETYNFHKAASTLAEYGFDCIRLSDDWTGADFLAHHKPTGQTLRVQLKSCLVVNEKYDPDLYMCFPIDRMGHRWYLVQHARLMEVVKTYAPSRMDAKLWQQTGGTWTWRANQAVRDALEPYAYEAHYGHLGFRECTAEDRANARSS